MAELLVRPIQLADQVTKLADEAQSFKQDCQDIKAKTEKLATLLRQTARASSELYERPLRRIIDDTEQVLEKTLTLVDKCRASGIMKRVFTIIPSGAFRKISIQLENSIGDVSWLLRVSASAADRDDEYLGLPPIAANEPILCLIWEQVAILYTGSIEDRADAAASLVSLARDNDRYGRLIMEEGGIPPLLKLAKEGTLEGQESAARAIGLLGRDPESVEHIVNCGVCSVFAKILKDGSMKLQAVVAWAVSELASNHPKCQDHFAQNNIIRFLVSHLAFETIQEHSKYSIVKQPMSSIHSIVTMANGHEVSGSHGHGHVHNNFQRSSLYDHDDLGSQVAHPMGNSKPANNNMHNVITAMRTQMGNNTKPGHPPLHDNPNPNPNNVPATLPQQYQSNQQQHPSQQQHPQQQYHHLHPAHITLAGTSMKARESEDPVTKNHMKAMAARALWKLCKGNVTISRNLTESRALLCFAVLVEKGPEDVQSYSAMALMEITAVAEQNADLRRAAFKPTSPAAKAVVEQMLKVIEAADSDLLIPCVRAIGNLARTFRATETRIIGPIVKLLDEREPEVTMEATIALNKFACPENFLSDFHSRAIMNAGGTKHLIQLVYFGEQMVQIPSLILLCNVASNVPDSATLAQDEVLIVLEWALKQAHLMEEPSLRTLLPEAKGRLEVYQSRGSRGLY